MCGHGILPLTVNLKVVYENVIVWIPFLSQLGFVKSTRGYWPLHRKCGALAPQKH